MGSGFASLDEALRSRAEAAPDATAFAFRGEREAGGAAADPKLSYADLDGRARALAARLAEHTQAGDRAALLFPAGLDFVVAFFACLYAGVTAVPLAPPRRKAQHDSCADILADCDARCLLTQSSLLDVLPQETAARLQAGRTTLRLDQIDLSAGEGWRPRRTELAFLQYTSGSTGSPKGVMVGHDNLLANLEAMARRLGNTASTPLANWLPHYHDLGLIMGLAQTVYLGSSCVVLSPTGFIQRPLSWLWAIHDYRAESAAGPNFAFDLCVDRLRPEAAEGLDLSCWRVAANGAEPVRAETMDRFAAAFAPYGFRRETFNPCYGLAEATLVVSGGARGRGPRISDFGSRAAVGCGRPLDGETVAIVDPETRARLGPGDVGEVWVAGANVARGYWARPDDTAETFGAEIAGEVGGRWLRTGDLGRLGEDGELYVTGRLKDVIIIRGQNHYPQDIEATAQAFHPELRRGRGAAFAVAGPKDEERLVLVHEVERTARQGLDAERLLGDLRETLARELELSLHAAAFLAPGALPLTTSGKVRRRNTKALWLEGAFDAPPSKPRDAEPIA